MSLGMILLIVLILLLLGAIPTWGHSRNWGYGPERRPGVGVGDRPDPRASGAHLRGVGSGLAVSRIHIVLVARPGRDPARDEHQSFP